MNIGGFSITTTSDVGIYGYNNTAIFIKFMRITENALSIGPDAIYLAECRFNVWNCLVSYRNRVLTAYNSQGVSNNNLAGTANNYGLYSIMGSIITIIGTQPAATTPYVHDSGGSFINANGTQISNLITAGLSCTWGTIQGGYYRHGNLNGIAMVTVQLYIQITSNLSFGTIYTVTGFPPAPHGAAPTCSNFEVTNSTLLDEAGNLRFSPRININAGSVLLTFSCTYLTNS